MSNDKASKFASSINGVYGDAAILNMWKDHFDKLYNSVADGGFRDKLYERLAAFSSDRIHVSCSAQDIHDAISKQKKGKSAGQDGIAMEAYIYGCGELFVHLSLLFNLFIGHCYLPVPFMQSVVVPLVKSKGGDLTDVNNYRAIALSNTMCKVLETFFLSMVNTYNHFDTYQFGFKAGHSTSFSTFALKEVVDYYTGHGSHVFACFVDFTKAFDKVNYWKLFNQLMDDNVNCSVIALLAFWCSSQSCCIRWKTLLSDGFSVGNGTRQGSLLSPYFFIRYIRDLICVVSRCGIGCNLGGFHCNILAYAGDLVLLSPCWCALQYLIDLLLVCADCIDMLCNASKTVCTVFQPVCKRLVVAVDFPCFSLNGIALQFVKEFRYLGHIINNKFTDDDDIKREIRNLFIRTNILIRRFSKCSFVVKLRLFKAYCLCLYDIGIWRHFSATVLPDFDLGIISV